MLSTVPAVVVCLSVRLPVRLQIMPHDRPETVVFFKWDVLLVAEFLLTSASRGPSVIAEPLLHIVIIMMDGIIILQFLPILLQDSLTHTTQHSSSSVLSIVERQ